MEEIRFSRNKLRGKIVEHYGTMTAYAKALGMTKAQLSNRLTGKTDFTLSDILKSMQLLNLSNSEVIECFFTPEKAP